MIRAITRCLPRLWPAGLTTILNFLRPGLARTVPMRLPSTENTTRSIEWPDTHTVNGWCTGALGPDSFAVPGGVAATGAEMALGPSGTVRTGVGEPPAPEPGGVGEPPPTEAGGVVVGPGSRRRRRVPVSAAAAGHRGAIAARDRVRVERDGLRAPRQDPALDGRAGAEGAGAERHRRPLERARGAEDTPVASVDSCQKMLHALGALPPLMIVTEPAAAAAVVRSVAWKMNTAFGSPSKSSVRPVRICIDPVPGRL